jgi:hypothetical protein
MKEDVNSSFYSDSISISFSGSSVNDSSNERRSSFEENKNNSRSSDSSETKGNVGNLLKSSNFQQPNAKKSQFYKGGKQLPDDDSSDA